MFAPNAFGDISVDTCVDDDALLMLVQASLEQSKAAEAEARAASEGLERERSALQLEVSDLKRQCGDLQQRVQSLTVSHSKCTFVTSDHAQFW